MSQAAIMSMPVHNLPREEKQKLKSCHGASQENSGTFHTDAVFSSISKLLKRPSK
jgi:hypothetical protein